MESRGLAEQSPPPTAPDGVSLVSGTLQSSPATTSPSGSLSGSQDDSDSDMAFSVNQSSSASESSLGKEGHTFREGEWRVQGDRGSPWWLYQRFLGLNKVAAFPPHPFLLQL